MIDFHVHLLPGIDDGASNEKMALEMLKMEGKQGVDILVATPHLYFKENTDKRIEAREKAFLKLEKYIAKEKAALPRIIKGFEVLLSEKLTEEPNPQKLFIDGTNTMLLEMPMRKWQGSDFEIVDYVKQLDCKIVLAHIDRYCELETKEDLERILSYNFDLQVNATSFINPTAREFIIDLIGKGLVAAIGSDAHNMITRASLMDVAKMFIERRLGQKYLDELEERSRKLLCMG